jgi:hypothetical protein
VAGLFLYGPGHLNGQPGIDDATYLEAMRAVRARVPTSEVHGWYYPDSLAHVAAWLGDRTGDATVLLSLRAADLAGSALVAAVCCLLLVGALRRSAWNRWLVPLLASFCMLLPPFRHSVEMHNVSGVVVGLLTASLLAAGSAGRTGWLCLSFAFKPYGLVMALARPRLHALLPLAVAGLAFLDTPGRNGLWNLDVASNVSALSAVRAIGLPVPWPLWCACTLALAVWLSRGHELRAMALGLLALPIAWQHTYLLAVLPLCAAVRCVSGEPQSQSRLARLLLLCACALAIGQAQFFGAPTGGWLAGASALLPSLAVATVAALTPHALVTTAEGDISTPLPVSGTPTAAAELKTPS